MRDLDLRQKGWTQEQIDAMDREEAAARKRAREEFEERRRREPPTPWIPNQPQTQEEMDARFRAWDAVGVGREEQNELARAEQNGKCRGVVVECITPSTNERHFTQDSRR